MRFWLRCALFSLCTACAPTHHVLHSRWVDAAVPAGGPTVQLAATAKRPKRLSVIGCEAPCERVVRELEDALFEARFELVDARAIAEDAARHQRTTLEAAAALGLDHVLFVTMLPAAPHVTGHFERNYFASPGDGQVGARISPSAEQADRFDILLARAEARAQPVSRTKQTIALSLWRVTGEQTLRARYEPAAQRTHTTNLTLFVRCQNGTCREAPALHEPERPARRESRRVQTSGPSQASYGALAQVLIERLVAMPER